MRREWISRRAFAAALLASAACGPAGAAAPTPEDDPAPFAESRAQVRYWPVATDHPRGRVVSCALADGGSSGDVLRRFNAPRPSARADDPTRRHVGVDLFANAGDAVIAIEDGRIVAFYPFLRARTGETSYALLVAHDGYVANYGEVRATSLTDRDLAIGDAIVAGQPIAEVSDTRQLHVETYVEGVTRNRSWAHGAPRPAGVLNPTALLLDLARNGRVLAPSDIH